MNRKSIEGTKTPDMPQGIIATEKQALRFANINMPHDLRRAGFVASVFPGERAWVINYSK